MNVFDMNSLDAHLAGLAKEIAPARNLWPGIAARIEQSPRRMRPVILDIAAAAAAACIASALTLAVLHGRPVPGSAQSTAGSGAFDEPRDARYVAARASLEKSFRERLAMLEPATRAKIEASLALIRQAHEDIRKALTADPSSPVLEQLWESTWHDEIDLYENVVRATQFTMTRT